MRTRTHTTGQLRPRNFIDQIVFRRTTEAAPRYDLCWLRGGIAMADTVTGGWVVHGRWILSRLKGTITALAGQLEEYDFGAATQVLPQPSPAATPPTHPHAPPHHELGGGGGGALQSAAAASRRRCCRGGDSCNEAAAQIKRC